VFWGKVEGIPTLSGMGVDLNNMSVMRGCNGDMRSFWGGRFELVGISEDVMSKKMDQRGNLLVKVVNTSA